MSGGRSATGALFPYGQKQTFGPTVKIANDALTIQDQRGRLYRYNPSLASTVNVTTAGNDLTGDGSVSAPWLTFDRALQFIGLNNPANVSIQFGAGTFTMPTVLNQLVNVSLLGTVSATESGLAVASIATQSNANQLVFTITRTPTLSNDAWRGKIISFANAGVLTGQRGWVYRNVGNVLYVTTGTTLAAAPLTTSSTISLLSLDTNLRYLTASNTLTGSSVVQVTGCQITGDGAGRVPFFVATDKFQFNDCYFQVNRPQIGQAGGAFIFRSYINSLGDTTEGLLSVVRGGNLRLGQGSVIDTQNAATNEKFIRVAQDAKLSFDGPVVCRGLESRGFSIEGANVFTEGGVDALDIVLFEDTGGTTTGSCVGAFTVNKAGEGSGGTLSLPLLSGHITGNYAVDATKDAYIRYVSTSTIVTGLGTNYVSADSGSTLSSRNVDGTDIIGAVPSYPVEFDGTLLTATSPLAADLTAYGTIGINTTAAAKIINLPASALFMNGAQLTITDYLRNAAVNNITINPNGADTIQGGAALVLNINGQSRELTLMGTDWVITAAYL